MQRGASCALKQSTFYPGKPKLQATKWSTRPKSPHRASPPLFECRAVFGCGSPVYIALRQQKVSKFSNIHILHMCGKPIRCTGSHTPFSVQRTSHVITHKCRHRLKRRKLSAIPGSSDVHDDIVVKEESEYQTENEELLPNSGSVDGGIEAYASKALALSDEFLPPEGLVVILSCAVGLMTGVAVVLFNVGVHEVHDAVWQGIPSSGAAWLRTQPLEKHWVQVLSVPVGGGVVVGILNSLRSKWTEVDTNIEQERMKPAFSLQSFFEPVMKTIAAVITLATGNSLGPEGPSVEIGASIGRGLGDTLKNSRERKLSLMAAGSAAGISSGFNAAVSGCFFAVEAVLRPLSSDSAPSLTTAMVLLSSVLASVVSQAGLGSDPAFKIPAYDFRSPAELPLYLVLGFFCGLVSVALTKCTNLSTAAFQKLKALTGIPDIFLPPLGSLCVGFMALAYPEVLYWGFQNVDILLESRPLQRSPPAILLLQLVGVKIVATSISRGSGLVGGYYAPSLFIGAALGSAYGKLAGYAVAHADPMYHLDALKVAVPQAYALVGMAATLAGVCQVPLTSVLLLFELTRDYRIIIPLMAAVGVSSWVASTSAKKPQQSKKPYLQEKPMQVKVPSALTESASKVSEVVSKTNSLQSDSVETSQSDQDMRVADSSRFDGLCSIDDSLCMASRDLDEEKLISEITVAKAMRTCFTAVASSMTVHDALEIMLARKEWCVLLVRDGNILEGIVTFADIQQCAERIAENDHLKVANLPLSEICISWAHEGASFPVITAYPEMSLKVARKLMTARGLRQIPIISREFYLKSKVKVLQGILDRDCILLACRAEATRRLLGIQSLPIASIVNHSKQS
ncbi:hypothetical protein GOP47_0024609 [Adiantum capillus-veneris]|uniref:Chloride channel protein n=1 Tax=Adiantum capillus-veneris TaxID=13818 RepID=A0A9D4Z3T9_ADICA|nr:hypothetical protein GOP47_0024609 [Adiantum capillus-veneris]